MNSRGMKLAAVVSAFSILLSRTGHGLQGTQSDPDAESLFRKMADKVATAKALHIACQGQFKTPGFEAMVKACLWLKEGGKMRMDLDTNGSKDGQPYSYSLRMISDGSALRLRENTGQWTTYAAPKTWNQTIALNLCRGGFPSGLELSRLRKEGESKGDFALTFRPVAAPVDFTLWKKETLGKRETVPIEFTVKDEDAAFIKESCAILWLDPESSLPLKRLNMVRSDRTLTVTEIYDKFLINEPVDDSIFSVPSE